MFVNSIKICSIKVRNYYQNLFKFVELIGRKCGSVTALFSFSVFANTFTSGTIIFHIVGRFTLFSWVASIRKWSWRWQAMVFKKNGFKLESFQRDKSKLPLVPSGSNLLSAWKIGRPSKNPWRSLACVVVSSELGRLSKELERNFWYCSACCCWLGETEGEVFFDGVLPLNCSGDWKNACENGINFIKSWLANGEEFPKSAPRAADDSPPIAVSVDAICSLSVDTVELSKVSNLIDVKHRVNDQQHTCIGGLTNIRQKAIVGVLCWCSRSSKCSEYLLLTRNIRLMLELFRFMLRSQT